MQLSVRVNSVQFSLKELRELEVRRIADEAARRAEAEAARVNAIAAADAARAAAIAAVAATARDEAVRIETARAEAARQERLALEAHEAAARARHQAELDALRVREELDLRRIEAKQKRPRWMIAVTALATIATGVLIWFSVQSISESEASNHAAAVATIERDNAIKEQQTSAAELAALQAKIAALDVQVSTATRRVLDAQSDADRQRASADLKAARDAKVAAQREAEAAEARRQAKIRKDGVHNLCVGQAVCR